MQACGTAAHSRGSTGIFSSAHPLLKVPRHCYLRHQRPCCLVHSLRCPPFLLIVRCRCRRSPVQAAAPIHHLRVGGCCGTGWQCTAASQHAGCSAADGHAAPLPSIAAAAAALGAAPASAVGGRAARVLWQCGHVGEGSGGGGGGTAGGGCVQGRPAVGAPYPQRGRQQEAAASLRSQRQLGRRLQRRQPPARGPKHL